jgi:ABC-type uncharacterized transport system permease subunit
MMHSLISWIAVILYALAAVSLVAALQGMVVPRRGERLALFMAVLAVPLHAAALWQGLWTAAGVNLALYNALSLMGWVMVTMLLLATLRQPVQSLGLVVFPFAAISAGLAGALGTPAPTLVPIGAPVDWHVVSSILAYAVFGLAFAQTVLLAWLDRSLRRRRAGRLIGMLPSLQGMEALLFQMLAAGMALLSVALITGWLFVEDLFAQDLAHKTLLSMMAWLVFAALLIGRQRAGWRGRTAIRWSLAGFVLLALAYFGSKVVLEILLKG